MLLIALQVLDAIYEQFAKHAKIHVAPRHALNDLNLDM